MKSTSSAVHILNGIIVHSTSRSQKCISLSSTEAEWYAPSAGVCDAYYLQHIVEFVTGDSCETLILHTDNSAVRMLSLKFGVGRLRHIKDRMLWLQEKMANYELDIRQVPTLQNIADLNTKEHGKHRFLSLLYMFGFVTSKGSRVGEDEVTKLQAKEAMKNHVKLIGQVSLRTVFSTLMFGCGFPFPLSSSHFIVPVHLGSLDGASRTTLDATPLIRCISPMSSVSRLSHPFHLPVSRN